MDLINQLSSVQKDAVTHPAGPLLVLAGAGSGKTRVLTYRIAYLMHSQGYAAHRILAITFTNRAAREMKDRVLKLVPQGDGGLWVTTFHAACLRILRREITHLGYGKAFVIYDESDQQTVIKDCLKEMNLDIKKFPPSLFSAEISAQKNLLIEPETCVENVCGQHEELVAQVYRAYNQRLMENNVLDFDDLLLLTVKLFRTNPDLLAQYRQKFLHVLVDEYQDTNHAQYVLVNLLASEHRNLTVVGDPDQSIYSWRGADIQNILSFERDYPDAQVIKLEENFRSSQYILETANHIIRYNKNRKEKKLWTSGKPGSMPVLFEAADERQEAEFIVQEVQNIVSSDSLSYGDTAVFYRTHAQSRVLEDVFLRNGIPYNIIGGVKFYERLEIKDIISYLKLLVNPFDEVALTRVINKPRRGIGNVSLERFLVFARDEGLSFVDALNQAESIPGLSANVKKGMKQLGVLLSPMQTTLLSITELTRRILDDSGYLAALQAERTVESRTRLENMNEFLSVTQEFDKQQGGLLVDFLNDLALYTDLDNFQDDSDVVALMSLHTAKGLEFPVVFLTGLEEGVFPHTRSFSDAHQLEEERRLCYVGVTRAREKLYLSYALRRMLYGNIYHNQPSRFISEIPPEFFAETEAETIKETVDIDSGNNLSVKQVQYRAGDRVCHTKWGEGVIVQSGGLGENAEVKVAFPGKGVKTLLVHYAPIRLV